MRITFFCGLRKYVTKITYLKKVRITIGPSATKWSSSLDSGASSNLAGHEAVNLVEAGTEE
jgi:hypothetical protein